MPSLALSQRNSEHVIPNKHGLFPQLALIARAYLLKELKSGATQPATCRFIFPYSYQTQMHAGERGGEKNEMLFSRCTAAFHNTGGKNHRLDGVKITLVWKRLYFSPHAEEFILGVVKMICGIPSSGWLIRRRHDGIIVF